MQTSQTQKSNGIKGTFRGVKQKGIQRALVTMSTAKDAEYPNCMVTNVNILGDGKCDNFGDYNTQDCGYDAGDCIEFNEKYPNCKAYTPDQSFGDGFCEYNTVQCGYDGGDCIEFNEKYPNCTVDSPSSIGDEYCDGLAYNTEECGFDGGDCIWFNEKYPNCTATYPMDIGNGQCDDYEPNNTKECGFDGGDCINACSGGWCSVATEVKAVTWIAVLAISLGLLGFGFRRRKYVIDAFEYFSSSMLRKK